VHVDAPVPPEFVGKFRGELGVMFRREVAEGVAHGQAFFLHREDIFTTGSVIYTWIEGTGRR
jgi:hypothetical protein